MGTASNKRPDRHIAAIAVCDIIDSCMTKNQLDNAIHCIRNYNMMFPEWGWVYSEEFEDALADKYEELKHEF